SARRDFGHLRRAVRRRDVVSPRDHFRGIAAGAASEFEDGSARWQQREEFRHPRIARGDLALGVGLGITPVELQRGVVHEAPRYLSGSPSISRMFCTAAPEAPLPRLSSRATSTA